MKETNPHGIFGTPPKDLSATPAGAEQYSPIVPGSLDLACVPAETLASFTMLAPPSTLDRRYHLALALRALRPGAPLLVLGPKDKGGSRIRKELEEFGCEVTESAKNHFKICETLRAPLAAAAEAAIEEGGARYVEELKMWSQPGVFSWNRIDPGSQLLIEALPTLEGEGADLGAGIGFLSKYILATSPKVRRLTLVEIDRRAVECARKNLEAYAKKITLAWTDLRHANTGLRGLDFVVMNPPFHDGGTEDQSLGQGFIQQAAFQLRPGGVLWLVANKHLPYEALLKSTFHEVELVKEAGGFKIYRASR